MNRDYDRIEFDKKYMASVRERLAAADAAKAAPKPGQDIPGGDMPGDVTDINEEAIAAALNLFPTLQKEIARSIEENPYGRCVISISGGLRFRQDLQRGHPRLHPEFIGHRDLHHERGQLRPPDSPRERRGPPAGLPP